MTRLLLSFLVLVIPFFNLQGQPKLTEVWRTQTSLPTPESVLYDTEKDILYVSCIDGAPDGKDGKGSIATVSADGKVLNAHWAQGLNAPKGMVKVGNRIFVSDISDIVIIDIAKPATMKRIMVHGAQFLNDVTADALGNVYVSDSKTGKVHRLKGNDVETYLADLQGVNGLLAESGNLYVLAKGKLLKYSPDKSVITLADGMDESTDGVVMTAADEFIVSCWAGAVYHIKDGKANLILDTRAEKSQTADIGYNPKTKVVYVPTFFKNGVVAYSVN